MAWLLMSAAIKKIHICISAIAFVANYTDSHMLKLCDFYLCLFVSFFLELFMHMFIQASALEF